MKCLLMIAMVALMGCDDEDFYRSGEGESCTRTDDCEAGLLCIDLECAVEEEGDTLCTPTVCQQCQCQEGYTGAQCCAEDGGSWSLCSCWDTQ